MARDGTALAFLFAWVFVANGAVYVTLAILGCWRKLIGQTLREVEFSSRYDPDVLAIRHRGEKLTTQLEDQTLDFGDTLLVAGGWGEIQRLRDEVEDFVVLTLPAEYSELMPARHHAPIAVGITVAMVAVMALELMANAAAVLI